MVVGLRKTLQRQVRPLFHRSMRLRSLWGSFRREQLIRGYIARRERYTTQARTQGLRYSATESIDAARGRLRDRGYQATNRAKGEIGTFAFIPMVSWHESLLPDLHELGRVTVFDYTAHGFSQEDLGPTMSDSGVARDRMNEIALRKLHEAHKKTPIDWVFMYATGAEVGVDFINGIKETIGVPVVNMCLDDKHSWEGPQSGGQRIGQIDIAPLFDISWTSARVATEWYLCEGGNPLLMPEGFDASLFRRMWIQKDIDVSFVGGAYGFRPQVVSELDRSGVRIKAFGEGWSTPTVTRAEQVAIFNRSRINLGMGGIGYSESLTNVKGRDFEVPGTGGGLYLTSYNPELARYLSIGAEIDCYSARHEIVELVRHHLSHPAEAQAIAEAGHDRAISEHRWLHRYLTLCKALGILEQ